MKGANEADSRRNSRSNPAGTLKSAADFTAGNAGPGSSLDSTLAERRSRVSEEQIRLRQWAEENGKLGTARDIPEAIGRGAEHSVSLPKKADRIIKSTRSDSFQGYGFAYFNHSTGATPSEYLYRLAVHNELLGDDIRLEKIIPSSDGKLRIVTSQPFIVGEEASPSEIKPLFEALGFGYLGGGYFYDAPRKLLLFDVAPRNVLKGRDGMLYPIDPVIQVIDDEFADFLRRASAI